MDRKKNLAIDIGALVVYLVVANPALTASVRTSGWGSGCCWRSSSIAWSTATGSSRWLPGSKAPRGARAAISRSTRLFLLRSQRLWYRASAYRERCFRSQGFTPQATSSGTPSMLFSESAFGATARARGRSLEVDCEFFGQKERRCLRQQLRSGNRPGLEDGRQSESKATYFSELPSCASASVESESSRWVASLVFNRENNNGESRSCPIE